MIPRLIFFLAIALTGCGTARVPEANPADADAVAAILLEHAKRTEVTPAPSPESCDCRGTGYITHGDGHKTPCPCGGPGACDCEGSAPLAHASPDIAPAREWRGDYAAALQAARGGPVLVIVHAGGATPRGDAFELDLRDYRDENQRAKVGRYFPGPYPAAHVLQLHNGRVKSARHCGPSG